MTDPHTFVPSNDLDSMLSHLPDQTLPEDTTYTPEWDATPQYTVEPEASDNDLAAPADGEPSEPSVEPTDPEIVDPADTNSTDEASNDSVSSPDDASVDDSAYHHNVNDDTDAVMPADNEQPVAPPATEADSTVTSPAEGSPVENDADQAVIFEENTDTSNGEVVLEDADPWANYVDDGVYGNSVAWNDDWYYQQVDGYCGPTSVSFILNQFFNTGIFDPNVLVNQALELGIDSDLSDGMYTTQICDLFNANGVAAHIEQANQSDPMTDLAVKLEEGCGVLATVDAQEIWALMSPEEQAMADYAGDAANHALIVTEINTNTGMVTLADPGTPEGNGLQVDINTFAGAWQDSDYEMVVTDGVNDELRDPSLAPAGTNYVVANVTGSNTI